MKTLLHSKKAMTLPEVIIVFILIAIVIGAGIAPYIMQQSFLKAQFARTRLQDDISVALAYMEKDIFMAESLEKDKATGGFEDIDVGDTEDHVRIGISTDSTSGQETLFT